LRTVAAALQNGGMKQALRGFLIVIAIAANTALLVIVSRSLFFSDHEPFGAQIASASLGLGLLWFNWLLMLDAVRYVSWFCESESGDHTG
jgi:hypothetical protein